jgi:hypothetical protein
MRVNAVFLSLAFVLMDFVLAAAQQSDQNQQILKLLQEMNGRFDKIEKRLDKIEGGAQVDGAPEPVSATPPQKKALSGWDIELFPFEKDGIQTISVARAHVPIGQLHFQLSLKPGPVSSYVQYRGKAFFKAAADGKYGFSLSTSVGNRGPDAQMSCTPSISVDDHIVIKAQQKRTDFVATGGMELQSGTYELTYTLSCKSDLDRYEAAPSNSTVRLLNITVFDVKVIGPDDNDFREFGQNELFTLSAK